MRAINKLRLAVAGATVTLLAVVGCAANINFQAVSQAFRTADQAGSPSPATKSSVVEVTMNEFSFAFATSDLTAGTHTFVLNNVGKAPHAMAIMGPGLEGGRQSETIDGGRNGRFTVTLQPGRYEVWCPVGNHRAQGMQTTLTVN